MSWRRWGVGAPWLLQGIGAGLLLFAGDLVFQATRPRVVPARALVASLGDFAWVLGSVALLVFVPFSPLGAGLVAGVAGLVGAFGLAQLAGIERVYRDPEPGRGQHRVCVSVATDVAPPLLWPTIRDLAHIEAYSPELARTFLRDDADPEVGAVRECHDTRGQRWAEHVERLDDAARALEVRFLTHEPGFPFPMRVMFGGWQVHPRAEGSRVEIWWSVTLLRPWLAPLMLPLLESRGARGMFAVVQRMAGAPEAIPRGAAVACWTPGVWLPSPW